MTTASAVTNAIGKTVGNLQGSLGDLTCKTSSFVIDTKGHGSKPFESEEKFHPYNASVELGKLLNSGDNILQSIADSLFESGIRLTTKVQIMVKRNENGRIIAKEIWTQKERFKLDRGRVYGHRLLNKY
ncbi:MAG: hypothetical protein ACPGSM_09630 [Thiolinea sp.]